MISISAGAFGVFAADLDNDGDLDVISTNIGTGPKIAWYKNNGSGGFGSGSGAQMIISTDVLNPYGVFAADLDSDGDLDVLSTSFGSGSDGKISWYENLGSNSFGPQRDLSSSLSFPRSIFAADLDNDGDIDVLGQNSTTDPDVFWFENETIHRSAVFPDADNYGSGANPIAVVSGDIDSNGDQDLVVAYAGGTIAVTFNPILGSSGGYDASYSGFNGLSAIAVGDIDHDGDLDIVGASSDPSGAYGKSIFWCRNTSLTLSEKLLIGRKEAQKAQGKLEKNQFLRLDKVSQHAIV